MPGRGSSLSRPTVGLDSRLAPQDTETTPGIMRQWFLEHLTPPTPLHHGRSPHIFPTLTLQQYRSSVQEALKLMEGLWSQATWLNRAYRLTHFENFLQAQGKTAIEAESTDVLAFVGHKTHLKNSTRAEYLSTLLTLGRHLRATFMKDAPMLAELRDACKRASLHDQIKQARPILPTEVWRAWTCAASPQHRLVILLAFLLVARTTFCESRRRMYISTQNRSG